MAKDLELKLRITADGKVAVEALDQVADGLRDADQAADQASLSVGKFSLGALGFNEVSEAIGRVIGPLGDLVETAEGVGQLKARLALAVEGFGDAWQALEDVSGIADRTGQSLQSVGNLYVKTAGAAKSLGISQEQVATVTETVSKAMRVAGAEGAAAEGALLQFSQAMGSGVLRGEEFNSVYEAAPYLIDQLAKGLGVATEDMRALANAGQLSARQVADALEKQAGTIGSAYATLPETVGQAMQRVRDKFAIYLGGVNEAAGVTETMASAVGVLANNMDLLGPAAGGLAAGGLVQLTKAGAAYVKGIKEQVTALLASRAARLQEAEATEASIVANAVSARNAQAFAAARHAAAMQQVADTSHLAASDAARIAALRELVIAETQLAIANKAVTASQQGLGAAMAATTVAARNAAVPVSVLTRAMSFLAGPGGILLATVAGFAAFALAQREGKRDVDALNAAIDAQNNKLDELGKRGLTALAQDIEERNQLWRDEVAALKERNRSSADALSDYENMVGDHSSQIAAIQRDMIAVNGQIEAKERELADAEARLADVRQRLTGATRDGTQATAGYAQGVAALSAALKARQAAEEAATETAQNHLKAQITAQKVAADRAKSMGDERGALEANAKALQLEVTARQLEAQAAEQAIARTRELLAVQQASTTAKREEIDQTNRTLAGLEAEAASRRALVAAAEQQAEIARTEILTYGDQSDQLQTLLAQRDRLTQSLAAYTSAQGNAVNSAIYLAQAQADLAAAEQQLADARARSGGEGQVEELQVYVGLVEQARARVDELTLATQGGAAADATAAQTKAQLAELNRLVADAARDAANGITLEIQAANRQQEITLARIDLASAEIASRRDLAAARGEAIAAASLEVDLMRQEVEAAKAAAESKREQAALLAEQARLMQVAAEAAGDYSAAQRAQVSAIEDAAELLRIEAEQLDVVARTKREAAQAAAELADQQRILAEAMREAGVVGVESMDEVSGAISRLTDSGQLEDLGDALDEAFRRGALAADEYKQALEEIEAKQDALKKQAGGASAAVDYEQLYAKYGTDTAALKAGGFGSGVDSRQVAQMLAAYEEWLREMGYLTRQARESAAPQAAAPNYAMSPSNVTINVEGILDVNDRATLDSLARKLKPVLGSLDRRGY